MGDFRRRAGLYVSFAERCPLVEWRAGHRTRFFVLDSSIAGPTYVLTLFLPGVVYRKCEALFSRWQSAIPGRFGRSRTREARWLDQYSSRPFTARQIGPN